MASEDVIELGSSDDEAEPALKKVKVNTMVHIPHKFSGSSTGSTKSSLPSIHKKLSGGSITIKKITNPHVTEVKNKINILRKPVVTPTVKAIQKLTSIKQALNPISVKMSNSQVAINRVPATTLKEPIKVSKLEGTSFNSLPSSITVKKALPSRKYTTTNMRNKPIKNIRILPKAALLPKITIVPNPLVSKSSVGDVLTVELDDDDTKQEPPNTKGPQWYLRPEEQKQTEIMEEQNNMEPKPSKFIEITIEDSPSKPVNNTHEIGAEFAITIEDSPIKFTTNKSKTVNCSDEENKAVPRKPKTKKKLEYPKKNFNNTTKTIEIEIEPMEVDEESQEEKRSTIVHSNNIEQDLELPETKEKDKPESTAKVISTEESESQKLLNLNNEDNEFHPVYQNFIDLCFTLENSEDMKKIVEKKIKGYYRQVPKQFRESEEFLDMVSSKIISMKAGPERMYLYIKDVVDELNFKRKSFKPSALIKQETNDKEAEKFFYGDESEFDSKQQRQIRKLEKTLKKLHRAIQKLEEQEVDFDDEEDSVYLLTERYKERMIRVHAKFCQLTNTKMPSEPRVHIEARPGQPTGPVKRLEKMINKKVPIGTPLPFPDFHDVLRCVREANDEDKLCWNEADIMEEARDLFLRCGKKLQRRRQENEWRLAASRISAELDPAKDSDELKMKLEQNKLLAIKKETELFNKFADKQNQMKLEAVEIGDKEAEESPVESEDDDIQEEDGSLENSEKRKEGLKRLLQKKFTKDCEKTEDHGTNESSNETKLEDTNKNLSTDMIVQNEESTCIKINSVESLSDTINIDDKIQSLSDDSSKIDSDIDELHLLQKLHSGNEVNDSTQNSSDSDSCIAISDSLDSSSDSKKLANEDVISIENSSYSESEANEVENIPVTNPAVSATQETVKEMNNLEIECSTSVSNENKCDKSNNDEYNESVENILLASSDEECDTAKQFSNNRKDANVYINDGSMSRRKTIIEGNNSKDNINVLNGKENDASSIKQSNDICKVDVGKKTDSDLQEVDINNDKMKSNEHMLIESHVNNFKDSKIISTINHDPVNVNIKLDDGKKNISDQTNGEQNTECDSVENVVGSSTEAMEVVTTTTPCDDVNGK